jgi:hypothetical protein
MRTLIKYDSGYQTMLSIMALVGDTLCSWWLRERQGRWLAAPVRSCCGVSASPPKCVHAWHRNEAAAGQGDSSLSLSLSPYSTTIRSKRRGDDGARRQLLSSWPLLLLHHHPMHNEGDRKKKCATSQQDQTGFNTTIGRAMHARCKLHCTSRH